MTIFIGGPDGLTWTTARAKVRGDLWRPGNSLPDDVVDRALHASVLELEAECKWLWLEEVTAIVTLDDATAQIDLPAGVGRVSAVGIRRGAWLEPLDETPIASVRDQLGTGLGNPARWAHGNGQLWFDSRAPAATEFEIILTAQTPDQLEDALASPCATLQRHQQAIIAGACGHVALTFMKNEAEAARQRAVFEKIVERMQTVEADRRGGFIQPDTWGTRCG